jgi:hypothetical protein
VGLAAIALTLTILSSPTIVRADGMPINPDDPWAKAIGDTRILEKDHIGCVTQRDVDLVKALQRNQTGLSMDMPKCTLFLQGEPVVVVNLEYGLSGTAIYAQIHLVGDQRRYWMDATRRIV